MNSQLLIPDKLKVGYQERSDTYTKKLAYVVYINKLNKIAKEKSWTGWVNEKLGLDDFDNKPTEGFVLNKDVGGVRHSYSSWNPRMEKVRVYDPRGFEFEIDIPNMLFILQECTSTKGKGLEGEFVYAWAGPSLVLLPTSALEYQQSKGFTALQTQKVSAKELVPGASYMTKKQDTLIYMGRFPWFTVKHNPYYQDYRARHTGSLEIRGKEADIKTQYFYNEDKLHVFQTESGEFTPVTSLTNLAAVVSNEPVLGYADRMDKLSKHKCMAPIKSLAFKPAEVEFKVIEKSYPGNSNKYFETGFTIKNYSKNSNQNYFDVQVDENNFQRYLISAITEWEKNGQVFSGWFVYPSLEGGFKDGKLTYKSLPYQHYEKSNLLRYTHKENASSKLYTEEEVRAKFQFVRTYIKLESGANIPFDELLRGY